VRYYYVATATTARRTPSSILRIVSAMSEHFYQIRTTPEFSPASQVNDADLTGFRPAFSILPSCCKSPCERCFICLVHETLAVSGHDRRCHHLLGGVPSAHYADVGYHWAQALVVIWQRDGAAYYARAEGVVTRMLCYLVVEPVLSGKWDWEVWRRDNRSLAKRGVAGTVHEAMQAAERAAV
jgi:hypothetical protein